MLKTILQMAAKRGTVSAGEVARELSIDAALAERLFSELERQGYFRSVSLACSAACNDCAITQTCGFFKKLRLWTLTEKGASTADRLSSDRD
jgi:hypothetical protein